MKASYLLIIVPAIIGFSSCSHAKQHKDSQVNARIDSLVMDRTNEMYQKANEDLDRRMSVEVKPKADSIVRARMMRDTVKH